MRPVVLLGGGGFLGAYLRAQLQKESMATLCPGSDQLNLASPTCIPQLTTLFSDAVTLVFLAAITPDKDRTARASDRNLRMAAHVAQAIRETNSLEHIVYISSDAVYGSGVSMIKESTPPAPDSDYGRMHARREQILAQLGLPIAIVRPTMIYGHGDTHNAYGVNRFVQQAIQGQITLFGGGEEFRDYIHADDAATLIKDIIERKLTGVWNLASGKSIRFRDLAALIGACQTPMPKIAYLERKQPITHRHFDISHLQESFPNIRLRTLETGIGELLNTFQEKK